MTGAEWLTATDPSAMLAALRGEPVERLEPFFGRFARFVEYPDRRAPERVVRLFAVACCRRIAQLLSPERVLRAIRTFESLGGRLHEPIAADGCLMAIETAERFAVGDAGEANLAEACKVAVATQSLIEFYSSVYDDTMGPFDVDLAATGEAADAVFNACAHEEWLERVPAHASRAMGLLAASQGASEEEAALAEAAAQCSALREMLGNPFAGG
jgi:hypothetical protein